MKYINENLIKQTIKDCFGIDFEKNHQKHLTIEIEDLMKYTNFIMETMMKSSIRETKKIVINEVANATKINYN